MRIFDKTKTIEITKEQCDLTTGYLKEEYLGALGTSELVYIYVPYTQKQLYLKEIDNLKYWFENDYKEMFEKCTRRIAIGKTMRDGSDPNAKLKELYLEAETKADRINYLTQLINNS